MDDQRIILRSSFGLEDLSHRILVQCIGPESIDRFCRERDDAPSFNDFGTLLNPIHFYSVFEIHFYCFHFHSKNGDSKTAPLIINCFYSPEPSVFRPGQIGSGNQTFHPYLRSGRIPVYKVSG